MNWLAHLLLSEPDPAFRLGNILPDLVPLARLGEVPAAVRRGIECHLRIDAFTDAHPVFRRSVQRFPAPYRRFGGVITDVFYDHFIARAWADYSALPLPEFAAEFYASFDEHRTMVPAEAWEKMEGIRTRNLLCGYGTVAGVRDTLTRISARLRRPFDLGAAATELETQGAAFQEDFAEFFPQLWAHAGPSRPPRSA